jgi:hypothetical protein
MSEVFESQGQNLHGLHPMKAQPEEKLPEGFRRNYAGFLLRDLNREVEVNQDAVKHEMEYLAKFATIACFVGGRPTDHQLRNWLETLCKRVDGVITLGRSLGKGFFLLKANHEEVARKLLPSLHTDQQKVCVFFNIGQQVSIQMQNEVQLGREDQLFAKDSNMGYIKIDSGRVSWRVPPDRSRNWRNSRY